MSDPNAANDWMQTQAKRLGVPRDFLLRLHIEREDWVFVVKMHALVETALTDVLIRHLGRPELDDDIRRLALRRKVDWARRMDLLPSDRLEFVEGLGSMRNVVAHNVSAIPTFTVAGSVANMNPEARRKLLHAWADVKDPAGPRFAIWIFALLVLVDCEKADETRAAALAAEEDRKFAERLAQHDQVARDSLIELLDHSQEAFLKAMDATSTEEGRSSQG